LSSHLLSKKVEIRIYDIIILPVFLYGCKTWSLTLRDEQKVGVFENRVLRRIFEPCKDEVTGGLRRLHNKEYHNLYPSPSTTGTMKSSRMKCAGHVARIGVKRNTYRLLVEHPEGKRPL
jgi:hypothetical protein